MFLLKKLFELNLFYHSDNVCVNNSEVTYLSIFILFIGTVIDNVKIVQLKNAWFICSFKTL